MKILRITLRVAMVLLALATTVAALDAAGADTPPAPFLQRPSSSRP
ncbi:hypothetical protein [Actinomadura sp. WMMA1423]|nr:hypothetical protein [Actinomadura sp. WMMA1423]